MRRDRRWMFGAASSSLTPDGFPGGSSGSHRASGRVSIAISMDGSADRTLFNQLEHKSELAQIDLAFDLGEIDGGPGSEFYWQDARFGGTLNWTSEHWVKGPPPGGIGPNRVSPQTRWYSLSRVPPPAASRAP
jgi:hypothetical protein